MITYKEAEFWMRVTLAVLALALFLTVHAIYWPAIVSLILTFILMPIRDGIIKVFLRLTGRKMPVSIAILISFVVFIFLVTVITNIIVKPLVVQTNLLAANFSNLVNRTADLVMQLENEQTQLYIPDQVKRIINDAFAKVSNYGIDGITNLLQSVFVIAGTVVEFFVVPIITFYFMKDGSLTFEESKQVMTWLAEEGVDAIEVSGGNTSSLPRKGPIRAIKRTKEPMYFKNYAAEAASLLKGKIDIGVVGGFRSAEEMEQALSETDLAFISMSRPFLRQPDLPKRWREGDTEPSLCISCSRCFGAENVDCIFNKR